MGTNNINCNSINHSFLESVGWILSYSREMKYCTIGFNDNLDGPSFIRLILG
jgi:hypothetical protein